MRMLVPMHEGVDLIVQPISRDDEVCCLLMCAAFFISQRSPAWVHHAGSPISSESTFVAPQRLQVQTVRCRSSSQPLCHWCLRTRQISRAFITRTGTGVGQEHWRHGPRG